METNQTSQSVTGNSKQAGGGTGSHESGCNLHPGAAFADYKSEHAPSFAPIIPAPSSVTKLRIPPQYCYINDDSIIGDAAAICLASAQLQEICHNLAHRAGWWTHPDGSSITDNPYCFSNKLMLVVSELAEAMEGDRKGIKDDKLPHRDMREVELADAVIRIFDLAGAYNMDLGGAIAEKLHFNQQRADHKPENRTKAGGKAY